MPCTIELVRSLPVGASLLRLTGTLDETFDKKTFCEIAKGVVVIDLDGVHRITSFGVREWIEGFKDLEASYVGLVRCRPAVVTQLNSVSNFGNRSEVLSIYAPYVTDTGDAFDVLIDLVNEHKIARLMRAPDASHPKTGQRGMLDDEASSYFSYVAGREPPMPPPYVEWLLSGTGNEACRVQKEVVHGITALWLSGNLDRRARFRRIADGLEGDVILILDGLGSVTSEGLNALEMIVTSPQTVPYVARVPEALLTGVAPFASRHNVPILSVLARVGTASNFEVTLTNLRSPDGPVVSAEVRDALTTPAPKHIAKFLTTRVERTTGGGTRSSPPPEAGVNLGKYELLQHIASGGMAQVYLARQRGVADFEKIVAIKRILPHLARTQRFVDMFAQEARLAAKVRHPNVVDIYELGRDDSSLFIAMEYIDGIDARTLMASHQKRQVQIPLEIALGVVRDVLSGLHAAHTATDDEGKLLGILHRDVSPRNILISVNGAVKLTDFGIAKAYAAVSQTAPGMVKGKLPYLAPEQLVAATAPAGVTADIFATGVVLFELLAGVHPFAAQTSYDVMKAIVEHERPKVLSSRPDVPPVVEAIVQRAISRKSSDRFQSAAEFRDEIDGAMSKLGLVYSLTRVGSLAASLKTNQVNSGDEIFELGDDKEALNSDNTRSLTGPNPPEED